MLCESRLWSMTYSVLEEVDPIPHDGFPHSAIGSGIQRASASLMPASICHSQVIHHTSTEQTGDKECSQLPGEGRTPTASHILPLQAQDQRRGRQISMEMEIPSQTCSSGDVPFLVPSFCQSICQNYSDLHIGGDQVLPLSANNAELCSESQPAGPFLHSCDVPLAVEDSPPEQISQGGPLCPLRRRSTRWRTGSGRDRSFLFQGCEGPFSNSLLNRYLEHKLLDLYRQYMLENMARETGNGSGSEPGLACPLLGSELVLTSLDQITLQLSREGNLEAGLAKDMVLSCLLRVASDMQSTEISTPLLQISNDAPRDLHTVHTEGRPQDPGTLNSSDLPDKYVV